MKLIISLIILISNILLCVYSSDISTYATVNSHNQNSFKKGDDITINCNLTNIKQFDVINVTITQPDTKPFFVYVNTTDDKKKFPTKNIVPGSTNTTEGTTSKDLVSVNIKNATEATVAGSYGCEAFYKEGKDDKKANSNKNVAVKFWVGDINGTDVKFLQGEKNNPIGKFEKDTSFKIECSVDKVTGSGAALQEVKLLQKVKADKADFAPVVDFTINGKDRTTKNFTVPDGISANDFSILNGTYGIQVNKANEKIQGTYKCEYTVKIDPDLTYNLEKSSEIQYKNFGLKIHLSASLIMMSLITMFK